MTLDRIDAMRTFVEIVDAGSFSGAASRLGMSVPAVSRRMGGFEARVGARLLERTTRHLALTESGRRYYKSAKQILADIANAEAELDLELTHSTLRVAVPDFFGRVFVAPLLPKFLERYRGLSVELLLTRSGDGDAIEAADAAIQLGWPQIAPTRTGRTLGSFRQVICASQGYLKRSGVPQRPEDLLEHSCIRMSGFGSADKWMLRRGEQELLLAVGGRLVCNDADAVLDAVLAGVGIARVPSFLVRDHVRGRRALVLLEEFEPPPSAVHLVGSERSGGSIALAAFVDHLAQNIDRERLGL